MKKAIIIAVALSIGLAHTVCQAQVKIPPSADCLKLHTNDYKTAQRVGYLSITDASEVAENFYSDQEKSAKKLNLSSEEADRTRAVWFSLESLKRYIWQVEEAACATGINIDSLGLGINFYFGKYPSDPQRLRQMGVPEKYRNRETLFYTATYKNGKTNIDFDPYNRTLVGSRPRSLKQALLDVRSSLDYKSKGDNGKAEESGVQNHGDLVPPPFNSGYFPSGQ